MNTACKCWRILLLAALILGLFSFRALAGPRYEPDETNLSALEAINQRWRNRARARAESNGEKAKQELEAIVNLRMEEGIHNLYSYSAALVMDAIEASRRDDYTEVSYLLTRAREFAPDFAGPDFCEAHIESQRGNLASALAFYVKGLAQELKSFQGSLPVIFNAIGVIMGGLFWTLLLFSALLAARHIKAIAHDFEERVHGFSSRGAQALALSLLLFPIAFAPNLALYGFLVILLAWFYMSVREKAIAATLALLMLIVPSAFTIMGHCLVAPAEPALKSMIRIREGIWSEKDARVLDQERHQTTGMGIQTDITFSEASALLYLNDFERAEPLFNELIKNGKLKFESTLMLGNVYYHWQKYDKAVNQYGEALKLDPSSMEAHFNLAAALSRPELVRQSADYVERSENELAKAKKLDPKGLATLTRYQVLNPGNIIADVRLPLGRIYKILLEHSPSRSTAGHAMFEDLSGGVPLGAVRPLSIIFLALLGILTVVESKVQLAGICRRCGKTFCRHCQTEGGEDVCVRCYSAFEQTAGMDPRQREKVRAESRLYVERRSRIAQLMSIAAPGAGHLLVGKTVRGIVFSMITATFFVGLLYRDGILRTSWANPAPAFFLPVALLIIAYAAFVAVVAWNASDTR